MTKEMVGKLSDADIALYPVSKLNKDALELLMRNGSVGGEPTDIAPPSHEEARTFVDLYYQMQEMRKAIANQIRSIDQRTDTGASHHCLDFVLMQVEALEKNAKSFLERAAKAHPMWTWFEAVHGIGPVLAAGLIAHLSRQPVPPTVGHWWRFAGYDPTQQWLGRDALLKLWEKYDGDVETRTRCVAKEIGRRPETVLRDATTDFKTKKPKKLTKDSAIKSLSRIPYNRPLKTLCWKISDQFVKLGEYNEEAFYANFYRQRKAELMVRNESGKFQETAKNTLAAHPTHANRDIYKQGMLPPGRIDLMARRVTVKMFLSHLHELWYELENEQPPPKPFAVEIQGHSHYISPPYQEAWEELLR